MEYLLYISIGILVGSVILVRHRSRENERDIDKLKLTLDFLKKDYIEKNAKYKVGDILEAHTYGKFIVKSIIISSRGDILYRDGGCAYREDTIIRKCECDKPKTKKKSTKRSKKWN